MSRGWFGTDYTYDPDYGNAPATPKNWSAWGALPAAGLGQDETSQYVRQLWIANELLPWMNPYSQAQWLNTIRGQRGNLEELGVAPSGIGNYKSDAVLPLTVNAYYQQLGPSADALRSLTNMMLQGNDYGYRSNETDYLFTAARMLANAVPKPGERWTVAHRRAVDAALNAINELPAPSEEWAGLLGSIVSPTRRQVDTGWFRPPSMGVRSWFS